MADNPYRNKYGPTWEEELRKTMRSRKVVWVNDEIIHLVAEGNRIYKGTDQANSWVVYHDALSQWWDPMAQELMERLGMKDRQIMAKGPNTARKVECYEYNPDKTLKKHWSWTNIYWNRLMGDSPELMPLDRHLFEDLKYGCRMNVGATRWMGNKDPGKFLFNTPGNAWKSLVKAWWHSPTSDRIVEDCMEFFTSVDEIVKSDGAFMDKNYHKGRPTPLPPLPLGFSPFLMSYLYATHRTPC